MSTQLTSLTAAVREAVAATEGLAAVHLAAAPGPFDTAPLPAATLTLDQLARPAGDPLDALAQARYELTLWRRDASQAANAAALQALADAAVAALLAEPTFGGLCVPGPSGVPCEVISIWPPRQPNPPLGSLALAVGCWLVPADALVPPAAADRVAIDGDDTVLASGPHTLAAGEWERRRVDRTFAGLDGTVSIDLGATRRPITVAGRLVGSTRADLLVQIADVAALAETAHALTSPAGRSFDNVRVDEVRWGRVLSPSPAGQACVGYEIRFSQLGS